VTSTSFEEMFGCLENTYDANEEKTYVAYGNSNDVILKENDEDTEEDDTDDSEDDDWAENKAFCPGIYEI
jgi:hypothetical protein